MRKLVDGRGIIEQWLPPKSSTTVNTFCFSSSNNGPDTAIQTKANVGSPTNTGMWMKAVAGYSLMGKPLCGITRKRISNGMSKSKERPAHMMETSCIGANDSANITCLTG